MTPQELQERMDLGGELSDAICDLTAEHDDELVITTLMAVLAVLASITTSGALTDAEAVERFTKALAAARSCDDFIITNQSGET